MDWNIEGPDVFLDMKYQTCLSIKKRLNTQQGITDSSSAV